MAKKKVTVHSNNRTEVLEEYEIEVSFICPVRGRIAQKVMGKRYAPVKYVPTLTRIDNDEFNITDLNPTEVEDI